MKTTVVHLGDTFLVSTLSIARHLQAVENQEVEYCNLPPTMRQKIRQNLKSMIRQHMAQFGKQWDCYLPGLLWAYKNTPHESTGRNRHIYLVWTADLPIKQFYCHPPLFSQPM